MNRTVTLISGEWITTGAWKGRDRVGQIGNICCNAATYLLQSQNAVEQVIVACQLNDRAAWAQRVNTVPSRECNWSVGCYPWQPTARNIIHPLHFLVIQVQKSWLLRNTQQRLEHAQRFEYSRGGTAWTHPANHSAICVRKLCLILCYLLLYNTGQEGGDVRCYHNLSFVCTLDLVYQDVYTWM